MPAFDSEKWARYIGHLVFTWARIESQLSMTIHAHGSEKPKIDFKARLKQWKKAVDSKLANATKTTEEFHSEILKLREVRDHLVHGQFSGCHDDGTVKYHVDHPNQTTRAKTARRLFDSMTPNQKASVSHHKKRFQDFVSEWPIHTVEYDIHKAHKMIFVELPQIATRLRSIHRAVNKAHMKSLRESLK